MNSHHEVLRAMAQRKLISAPTLTGHGIGNIKAHNLRAVLLTLLQQGPTSRVRLAQLTGLSSTTITNLIAELLEQGVVAETGKEGSGSRRPPTVRTATGTPARPAPAQGDRPPSSASSPQRAARPVSISVSTPSVSALPISSATCSASACCRTRPTSRPPGCWIKRQPRSRMPSPRRASVGPLSWESASARRAWSIPRPA